MEGSALADWMASSRVSLVTVWRSKEKPLGGGLVSCWGRIFFPS